MNTTNDNGPHVVRGGCLRNTDPMSVWTSYSGVMTTRSILAGFRTTLTGRTPR